MRFKLNISRIWQIVQILICVVVVEARKPMTTEPHPHTGVNKPYIPGDPGVTFTKSQLKELQDGKMVQDILVDEGGGRTIAVQEVHAPQNYVWDRILDFDHYAGMVPKVLDSYIYERGKMRNGAEVFKTFLQFGFFGLKFDSYIYHTYYPKKQSVTWTLDYTKKSMLDDSVGFWHVKNVPSRSDDLRERSRIYYSCAIRVPKWTPRIVKHYLSKVATREANEWVKAESEKKYNADRSTGCVLEQKSLKHRCFHGLGMPNLKIGALPTFGGFTFGSEKGQQVAAKTGHKAVEQNQITKAAKAVELQLEQRHMRSQTVLRGLKTLASVGVGYGFFMLLNRFEDGRLEKWSTTNSTTTTTTTSSN